MMAVPGSTPELARVPTGGVPHGDEPPWQWPIDVTVYDRAPQLTTQEARPHRSARGRVPPGWSAAARDR